MEEECLIARDMSQNHLIKYLYCFKLTLCVLSFISSSILLYKKHYLWLAHVNCRWLFLAHVYWNMWIALTLIPAYVIDLYRYSLQLQEACAYLIPIGLAVHLKLPYLTGIMAQTLCMLFLTIERYISTLSPEIYEQNSNPKYAILTITISSTFSIFMTYGFILSGIRFDEMIPIITARSYDNEWRNEVFNMTNLVIESLCVLIFLFLWISLKIKDRKLKKKVVNLGSKYQISESRMVVKRLLPITCFHLLIMLINSGGLVFFRTLFPHKDYGFYAVYLEFVTLIPMYMIITPWVLYRQQKRHKGQKIINNNKAQDEYFNSLKHYFDSALII